MKFNFFTCVLTCLWACVNVAGLNIITGHTVMGNMNLCNR